VITSCGSMARPSATKRAAQVAALREASLVTTRSGWPRRRSSASSAAAPGSAPVASTRTP
jgi:hypothetical protein